MALTMNQKIASVLHQVQTLQHEVIAAQRPGSGVLYGRLDDARAALIEVQSELRRLG